MKNSLIALLQQWELSLTYQKTIEVIDQSENTCYTIRYYTPNIRKSLKDVYIIEDNYMWVK